MEKIKVNMSPNPLDVQTIHASQNDGEARQWEFELHNNGELIDTSGITEQLFFKAYKGGTEQILPENTSTPTTSPFKGDIRYPQGLLTDQEFTYRQSPTEEDGLAKITDIKGNTLVWNQLFNSIPLSSSDGITTEYNATTHLFSITNNNRISNYSSGSTRGNMNFSFVKDHKYFIRSSKDVLGVVIGESGGIFHALNTIFTAVADYGTPYIRITYQYDFVTAHPVGDVTSFYLNVFDLTAMGFDSLTVEQFTSLFPLSYYAYNQGSLLSFMGNGIKTVGFNQWDEEWEHGSLGNNGENTGSSSSPEIRSVNYIPILQNTAYYLKTPVVTIAHYYGSADLSDYKGNQYIASAQLLNIPNGTKYIRFRTIGSYGDYKNDICLNISDPSRNGQYEHYTESTLSLPISTYFPNGMKSAGNVYDELTESKAITRAKQVNLWDYSWAKHPTLSNTYYTAYITDCARNVFNGNRWYTYGICNTYPIRQSAFSDNETMIALYYDTQITAYRCFITDLNANNVSPSDFATRLQTINAQLVYAIDTPTETSFSTASLVTENAEIPLSNNDGALIGKCTEQLSENPGFIDAKIKLSDSDGTCYSNKIQLHIERSPQ